VIIIYIFIICVYLDMYAHRPHNGERSVLSRQSDCNFTFWRKEYLKLL